MRAFRYGEHWSECHIGAYAVIGDNVTIRDTHDPAHVVFYPHVRRAISVRPRSCRCAGALPAWRQCDFAKRVVVGAMASVCPAVGWQLYKILQSGGVVVEDNVEVQANACVDGPSIAETRLQAGVKVDTLSRLAKGRRGCAYAALRAGWACRVDNDWEQRDSGGPGRGPGHCTVGDEDGHAQSGIGRRGPGKIVSGIRAITIDSGCGRCAF